MTRDRQQGASADADRATRASPEPASGLGHSAGIPSAINLLALMTPVLRAYVEEYGPTPLSSELELIRSAERLLAQEGLPS